VYSYKSNFLTTTREGDLISIDRKGNVNLTKKDFDNNHQLVSTTKTLVTLNNNKLTIKDKTLTLDFANYSKPKLFYINGKIYEFVTKGEANTVLVYKIN